MFLVSGRNSSKNLMLQVKWAVTSDAPHWKVRAAKQYLMIVGWNSLPESDSIPLQEYSDPSSDAMAATKSSGPHEHLEPEKLDSIAEDNSISNLDESRNRLEPIQEVSNQESSKSLINSTVPGTNAQETDDHDTVDQNKNGVGRVSEANNTSVKTPPWIEGVSKDVERKGEDHMRPTSTWANHVTQSGELKDVDSAGNVMTRIDIDDKNDKSDSGKSLKSQGAGTASGLKQKLSKLASILPVRVLSRRLTKFPTTLAEWCAAKFYFVHAANRVLFNWNFNSGKLPNLKKHFWVTCNVNMLYLSCFYQVALSSDVNYYLRMWSLSVAYLMFAWWTS